MFRLRDHQSRLLAITLTIIVAAYIGWKISQSPEQALQFAFNGLSVGAVYALLAMGFTIVYSTVWFFDLYYGAAAALGAYGVFYLRSQDILGGQYEVNEPYLNVVFALVTAGVAAWALHVGPYARFRARFNRTGLLVVLVALAAGAGVYMGLVLSYPGNIHVLLGPAIGVMTAVVAGWALWRGYERVFASAGLAPSALSPLRGRGGRGGRGRLLRLVGGQRPRLRPVLELGSVVPAGRDRRPGPIPGAVRLYARTRPFPPDHARRLTRCPAGNLRLHHHRLSTRAASAARGLRQRSLGSRRSKHQGIQRLYRRGGSRRLCRSVGAAQGDLLR